MNTSGYTVICPSCGTGNRIPADKEGLRGRCGRCRALLPPLYCHPQQLTERTFDEFVRSYPGPVLAEFWGPNCSYCVSFAPTVRALAGKLAGKAAVGQINTQENQGLADRFGIRGIPAVLLLKQGRVVDQLAGARPLDDVLAWFRRLV